MTNQQLITDSLALIDQLSAQQPTTVSGTAVLQRIDNGRSQLAAYLITEPQDAQQVDHANLLTLVQKIETGPTPLPLSESHSMAVSSPPTGEWFRDQQKICHLKGLICPR